jgi:uncharacterized protein YjbI with pentapeptide repeats
MQGPTCKDCESRLHHVEHSGAYEKGNGKLCIFHDPDEEKDTNLFLTKIREKIEAGDYDFSGFIFPAGTADFSGFRFEKGADFSRATFLGEAVFKTAFFGGVFTDFSGARFLSNVDFSATSFNSSTVFFSEAVFCGATAKFQETCFKGETINFTTTRFDVAVDFAGASFEGMGTYFTETTFGMSANFSNCHFRTGITSFKWVRFGGDATFIHSEFSGDEATFHESRFSSGTARFDKCRFDTEKIVFIRCRFSGGGCRFNNANFGGEVTSFRGAEFAGATADFSGAHFSSRKTYFHSASFSADLADFSDTEFSRFVTFQKSAFSSRTTAFDRVKFLGKIQFAETQFFTEFPPTFKETEFRGYASFRDAKFQRGVEFDVACFLAGADFSRVVLLPDASGKSASFRGTRFIGPFVTFDHVDLRHTLFSDFIFSSQLRTDGTKWPSRRYFFYLRKRFTCADEMYAKKPDGRLRAAAVLRELQRNMQKIDAQRMAGDFLFSARECRRTARHVYSPRRYLDLVFGAWLSGYGQKMWNIALSAIVIIILFAILFFFFTAPFISTSDAGFLSPMTHAFANSLISFLSGGFIGPAFSSPVGRVLIRIEGVMGVSMLSALIGITLRRKREKPPANTSMQP